MGKVTKFTGSKLLGAELRRLRGGRSLKQISELSKSAPLCERIASIAAPTLSQVENGISFPSLETLHAIAHLYKRPVQQLLDFVVQESLVHGAREFDSEAEALAAFQSAHAAAEWTEALAASHEGERLASPDAAPVWRMRRAVALQELGMERDALDLLMDALEDPDLPAERGLEARLLVANALGRLGRIQSAVAMLAAAKPKRGESLAPELDRRVVRTRAYLTILAALNGAAFDEAQLRDCLRDLEAAAELCEDEGLVARMRVHAAACHWLLGNRLVARADLRRLLSDARQRRDAGVELEVLLLLGSLERRAGKPKVALVLLEEAATLADRLDEPTTAFEASFEAYLASTSIEPARASQLLKRCTRFHPFVQARSVNALLFERLAQEA